MNFSTAGLTNVLQSVPGLPTQLTQLPSIDSAKQAVMSALKTGHSATSFLGSSPNIAKMSFGDTFRNFADSNLVRNAVVGNFSADLPGMLKKFSSDSNSMLASFTSGSNGLVSQGLTWVAGTTDKSINGIDLPSGMSMFGNLSSFLGKGQLAKLASFGGDSLSSAKGALAAVTGNLSSNMNMGRQAMSAVNVSMKSSSPLSGLGSMFTPIVKTVASVVGPRTLGNLAKNNLTFLPPAVRNIAGGAITGFTSSILTGGDRYATDLNANIFGIGNLFDGNFNINGPNGLFSQNGYGSRGYYGVGDEFGGYMHGHSNFNGSDAEYQALINAINQLCGNANFNTYPYGTQKTAYDLLMQRAMQSGAGALVQALLNCQNSGRYFDQRTANIMGGYSSSLSMRGDAYTYRRLMDHAGRGYSRNPLMDIIGLFTNSNYDHDHEDVDYVMNAYGYTPRDLGRGGYVGKYDYYDGGRMTVLQQGNRRYQDKVADNGIFSAINMAMALFG